MKRDELAGTVAKIAGSGVIKLIDPSSGWPASAEVITERGPVGVSLHVGPVGLSQRDRDEVERRFQNPGSDRPIVVLPGTIPILLGVWRENATTVFVGMDAFTRVGRRTRFSLFVPLHLLRAAAVAGWAEHHSSSGERLFGFSPSLLPVYVELVRTGVQIDSQTVQAVMSAAGLSGGIEDAATRGRRTASQLIRDAVFSKLVRETYEGFCAMCGLNYSLVVGAHIYPAAAPGSRDEVWNGIALCHNHHAAFDAHMIFVNPNTRTISLHSELKLGASRSTACETFVRMTFGQLREPSVSKHRPHREMFERRYSFFDPRYHWAS
jgi:hypothetical protein